MRKIFLGRKDNRQSYSDTLASQFGPLVHSSVGLFFTLETFISTILPKANKPEYRTNVING